MNLPNHEIIQQIISESGISQEQLDNASDGQIIKKVLILLKNRYPDSAFMDKKSFRFVVASNLEQVSYLLFCRCSNLELIHAPNVDFIANGNAATIDGAFSDTKLRQIYFPLLENVAVCSFYSTEIQKIAADDLAACRYVNSYGFQCSKIAELEIPQLIQVGSGAFQGNPLHSVNLPSLKNAGDFAFCDYGRQKLTSQNSSLEAIICLHTVPSCRSWSQENSQKQRLARTASAAAEHSKQSNARLVLGFSGAMARIAAPPTNVRNVRERSTPVSNENLSNYTIFCVEQTN